MSALTLWPRTAKVRRALRSGDTFVGRRPRWHFLIGPIRADCDDLSWYLKGDRVVDAIIWGRLDEHGRCDGGDNDNDNDNDGPQLSAVELGRELFAQCLAHVRRDRTFERLIAMSQKCQKPSKTPGFANHVSLGRDRRLRLRHVQVGIQFRH